MRIHNLYTDEQGESHFRDIEVEWTGTAPASRISDLIPVKGMIFRETGAGYDLDWHPAPRRQYIINLTGGVEITASDGEVRRIEAGEVLFVEDLTGKGHLSKNIEEKIRYSIFVPIE